MWPYWCYKAYKNIFSTYKVLEGSAEIEYDGLEAYKVATIYAYAPSNKLSHYDISSTPHQLIKSISLSFKLSHVKVHQDDGDTYNNIDECGIINIEVDILTKYFLWNQIHTGETHQPHEAIFGAI